MAAVITDYTAVLLNAIEKTAVNRGSSKDTAVLLWKTTVFSRIFSVGTLRLALNSRKPRHSGIP